ncbi:MAG TPA: hypothetical protein DHW49_05590, partial [Anaerolineae bacterium]|nr:hypothetical protein [Anaerolineae bacterium]
MQNKVSEEKLAKEAYDWLSAYPVYFIFTLFIGIYFLDRMWIDFNICYRNYSSICKYSSNISNIGAALIAGLWSLVFLKYVNNKDSAFLREYGVEALKFVWLSIGILLGGITLDLLGSINSFFYLAVFLILMLWFTKINGGFEKIRNKLKENPESEIPNLENTLSESANSVSQQDANDAVNLSPSKPSTEKSIEDVVLIIITGLYILYFISPFCWYVSAASLSEGLSIAALIPFVFIGALIFAWQENKKNNKVVAIVIALL